MSLPASGYRLFPAPPETLHWVDHVRPVALAALGTAPRRHGGTWAPGVDLLPNDAAGAVSGGPPLTGAALKAAQALFGPLPLHAAQISAVWPGYPQRDPPETEAAHRYRRDRDAAHLDGLLPEGPHRRRHLREPHAWVLGIGLGQTQAAPLVVWEGSAAVMRAAFQQAFAGVPPAAWGDLDVTQVYQDARRKVFQTCPRSPLPLAPGQAVLLDRHLLHGTAPWQGPDAAPRITAFFRPLLPDPALWLDG